MAIPKRMIKKEIIEQFKYNNYIYMKVYNETKTRELYYKAWYINKLKYRITRIKKADYKAIKLFNEKVIQNLDTMIKK